MCFTACSSREQSLCHDNASSRSMPSYVGTRCILRYKTTNFLGDSRHPSVSHSCMPSILDPCAPRSYDAPMNTLDTVRRRECTVIRVTTGALGLGKSYNIGGLPEVPAYVCALLRYQSNDNGTSSGTTRADTDDLSAGNHDPGWVALLLWVHTYA